MHEICLFLGHLSLNIYFETLLLESVVLKVILVLIVFVGLMEDWLNIRLF